MKKDYICPEMRAVSIDNVCLLSGSPDLQSIDANPSYPTLASDFFEVDLIDD